MNNKHKNRKELYKLDIQQDFVSQELYHILEPITEIEKKAKELSDKNFRSQCIIEVAEDLINTIDDESFIKRMREKIDSLIVEIKNNEEEIKELNSKIPVEREKYKHIIEPLERKSASLAGILRMSDY